MDGTLKSTTTLDQSGLGSNDHEKLLPWCHTQGSRWRGVLHSCSWRILQPQPTGLKPYILKSISVGLMNGGTIRSKPGLFCFGSICDEYLIYVGELWFSQENVEAG